MAEIEDTAELHGVVIQATVGVNNDAAYGPKNVIKAYRAKAAEPSRPAAVS